MSATSSPERAKVKAFAGRGRAIETHHQGDGRMDIRLTLTQLCEAFNAHDLDRIMTFFSDDCVLEMPRGSEPWGSDSDPPADQPDRRRR